MISTYLSKEGSIDPSSILESPDGQTPTLSTLSEIELSPCGAANQVLTQAVGTLLAIGKRQQDMVPSLEQSDSFTSGLYYTCAFVTENARVGFAH